MSQPTTGVDTEGFYDSDDFDIDDISDHLYEWAINTREFKAFTNWDDKGKTRLLSIDGPLGYRETMREWAAGCLMAASTGKTARPVYVASYFDDYTAKNAVNIAPLVKGLIESIVQEQPDLQDHWGHKNDEKRPQDVDSLSQILHNMTQDQRFVSTYFIVNDVEAIIAHRDSGLLFEPGIDPLKPLVRTRKLTELQRLINKSLKNSQNVKWLLSSCFMPREMTREIELHILKDGQQHLKLDLPNDPNGQWSGLTRKYGSLKIRESCERLQYNLSVSEQEELESQLELPTCYFRAIDIALAVASHRSSKERFVSSLKYLLSSKSSIYGIVQKSFSLLGDLYPDEKDMIFAIINAVFSAARPVPLGDLAAMTAWPYEEAILPSYIKLHLPVLLQIRDDGVWVKHVNILAPGFGKYLPLFACSCLSATFRLLNCDYSEPGDWKKNYSNYNPRIGLATIIWIDFLAELNCGDTDSFYLAKQLLTGRHSLIAWLRELNNRALMADAFRAITQFNNKMDGQVPDKSVGDIMKELATFTSWFLHRSPSEEFQNNLREELLVAEDLPLLRQMLLPGMFPMLRNAPLIQGTSDPCLHLLIRTSSVQGICFSPDGGTFATASDDGYVRVWNTRTGNMLYLLQAFHGPALGVVIHGVLAAFDRRSIKHSETSITDLSFSHDGSWIAAGLTNGTIALWVWPMSSGGWKDGYKVGEAPFKPAYLLGKHDGVILSVSFTSGGERNLLASTSADGTMRIWDMQKVRRMMAAGQPPDVELFPNADAKIRLVAISQNGRMVASATYGGDVSLWDIETGLRRCSEKNVIDKPVFMKFSPNNKLLVARSSNGTAIVWAVAVAKHTMTIEPRFTLKHDLALGASTVQAPGVRFDPQGKLLAMGSENNKVHVFDVSNAEPKTGCGHVTKSPSYTFGGGNGHVRGVAFSPDSKLLASCGQDRQGDVKEGSVKIWELGSSSRVLRSSTRVLRPLHRLTSQKQFCADEPCPDYVDVEFTATGDKIISVDAGGRAAIWTPPNETGGQYQYHVVNRIMRTKLIRSIRIDPRFPSYLLTEYGAQKWQFSGEQSGREDAALLSKWLPLDIDMERGRILWKGDRIRCSVLMVGSREHGRGRMGKWTRFGV
ncbi:WD40 repeat-like-containing domain protein [Cordyceps fumosorosea ARSEF 2679]|uniref:WD40 repeat-like-containing domain protein n=1 Tax=Cordyceps fumosorosea (strain ARSEF 2679) TaxID=1081104 RepID=A0A168ART7_CORFA|nr:WD40 repeat-like-containing domain protein [Cordyceps fumosorosea ARSEF 2679]OAA69110.1 WD40 repeat-like-containing domain protein [Cordyceps fumosorosea ARSEF 2679]